MRLQALLCLLSLLTGTAIGAQDDVRLSGRIADENGVPLGSAKLTFRNQEPPSESIQAYTDSSGVYSVSLPGAGTYLVTIEKPGYFSLLDQTVAIEQETGETDFLLNHVREVFESVEIVAAPPPINMDTTRSEQTVTGTEIVNIPYPNSNNLKDALRSVPGIVQDGRGRLHVDGGREDQTVFQLNGFTISDPLTGQFDSRLSVESVQTVDLTSSRSPAEHGKGSAGVLEINTKTGDDEFRAAATNFFPGVEYQKKGLVIGNWTPRVNVSGPIKRGRAWFSNSFDTLYTKTVVKELPEGEDRSASWRFSNHLGTQVNISPSNILHTGFLVNVFMAPRFGLGVLDPWETTVDQRSRQWFFHIKDQIYLPNQTLVEIGYAANRTFSREIPQGQEIYEITPDGRQGNFFLDAARESSRDQILANTFLPSFTLFGEHRVKVGADLDRLRYWQDARRTGFDNYGLNFERIRSTVFEGDGEVELVNYETSFYVQDSWRVRPGLLLEVGLRSDWDQILRYTSVSPRFGFAWQPPGMDKTKISGGYGVIYDATNLGVFTRPMDQYSLTSYFDTEGTLARGPALTVFTIPHQRPSRPRYRNLSLGLEQEFGGGVHGKIEVLRKRGEYGFTYVNAATEDDPTARAYDALYQLTNDRRDEYEHVRVTVRQTIRRKYEWLASYTRSRSRSNSVMDASIDEPVIVEDNVGPMPWDAPHRIVSWGYLPTPFKKWSVAYLVEYRTGFPFSTIGNDGRVIGAVNTYRFPDYFRLNFHLERRFALKKHLWAMRMGCNNLTNHSNPIVVNNSVSSMNYLQFYGGADRSFNFRIRWLGRSGK